MVLSSSSIASLAAGLVLLVGTWYFAFYHAGATGLGESLGAFVVSGLVVGGLAWLGLLLLVLGILILII